MENGKIFISYRREDTSGESGRLKDTLEQIFGKEKIFYDVETLEVGINFDQSIAKALNESNVLLAMIGPHWMKVTDSKGVKRLSNPEDWVRKEIAEALKRGLRVIPILVNGADMPSSEDLPEDLKELAMKHAQELTSSRWNYDVGVLTKVLEKLIIKNPQIAPQPSPQQSSARSFVSPSPEPKKWWAKNYVWAIGGILSLMIVYKAWTFESDINPTLETYYNLHQGEEIVSYLYFVQDGTILTFDEYDEEENKIGKGTCQVEGENLYMDYTSLKYEQEGKFELITNDSGETWEGSFYDSNTGDYIPSRLSLYINP